MKTQEQYSRSLSLRSARYTLSSRNPQFGQPPTTETKIFERDEGDKT